MEKNKTQKEPEKIRTFKALDKDFKCKNFQFEVGKSYHEENVQICHCGFHSCTNPFDILNYYDLTQCRFAEVEIWGKMEKHSEDSKIASSDIFIKQELSLSEFISIVHDYMYNECKNTETVSSGDGSQLASSGDGSQLASSGYESKLELNGSDSVGANIGYYGQIKGVKGTWITLAEYESGKCICVKSELIDGKKLKENTWYKPENKKFTEIK